MILLSFVNTLEHNTLLTVRFFLLSPLPSSHVHGAHNASDVAAFSNRAIWKKVSDCLEKAPTTYKSDTAMQFRSVSQFILPKMITSRLWKNKGDIWGNGCVGFAKVILQPGEACFSPKVCGCCDVILSSALPACSAGYNVGNLEVYQSPVSLKITLLSQWVTSQAGILSFTHLYEPYEC